MARILIGVFLVFLLSLVGGGLVLYLSYGIENEAPNTATVPYLEKPVTIGWYKKGATQIEASEEIDVWPGLGYVHGFQHTQSLIVWRQTALGRLGEWFGEEVVDFDKLTRQLRLATLAKEAYEALPSEDKVVFERYSEGVNAALRHPNVQRNEVLVELNLPVEPWEPWHSLIIERLFAWLSTPYPTPEAYSNDDAVYRFFDADRRLRGWLHLFGFENSMAWILTAPPNDARSLFQRHVYGDAVPTLFQEVSIRWNGQPAFVALSLPGTPFLPSGRTPSFTWTLLFSSPTTMEWTLLSPASLQASQERIALNTGEEILIPVAHTVGFIPLQNPVSPSESSEEEDAAADSMLVLRWSGFSPVSDWSAWRSIVSGEIRPFRLLRGDGLLLQESGFRALGAPAFRLSIPTGFLISNSAWSPFAAARLNDLYSTEGNRYTGVFEDTYSTWAADTVPSLVAAADRSGNTSSLLLEAVTYLRNWDYSYDQASIAATIYDTWVQAYYADQELDLLDLAALPDSTQAETQVRLLIETVEKLREKLGSDLSRWRWEHTRPSTHYYPLGATASANLPQQLHSRRYAPLLMPRSGHPSTLVAGTTLLSAVPPAPAAWEGTLSLEETPSMFIRRQPRPSYRFLDRNFLTNRPLLYFTFSTDALPERTTTLNPPKDQP